MDESLEMETAAEAEHEELMNAIEIIAETSDTTEEFLAKFKKLREEASADTPVQK